MDVSIDEFYLDGWTWTNGRFYGRKSAKNICMLSIEVPPGMAETMIDFIGILRSFLTAKCSKIHNFDKLFSLTALR